MKKPIRTNKLHQENVKDSIWDTDINKKEADEILISLQSYMKGLKQILDEMNFSEIKNSGFKGVNTDLKISLFEDGVIWRKQKENYLFIYYVNYYPPLFSSCEMSKKDWLHIINSTFFDIKRICSYANTTEKKLINNFPSSVRDAVDYFGYHIIFGTNNKCFKINEER